MTTYALLPDLDADLVGFLKNHVDLSPLHGGRVGTSLPAGGATSIRIASLGGPAPWPWLTRTEYQVECWGGTEIQAQTLARTVYAAVWEMPGTIDNIVTAVVTISPYAAPDLATNRFRYIVQVQLEATP